MVAPSKSLGRPAQVVHATQVTVRRERLFTDCNELLVKETVDSINEADESGVLAQRLESEQAIDNVVCSRGCVSKIDDSDLIVGFVRINVSELLIEAVDDMVGVVVCPWDSKHLVLDLDEVAGEWLQVCQWELLLDLGLNKGTAGSVPFDCCETK